MLELRTPTPPDISIQTVTARMLAAVRRQVRVDEIGSAWRPALDKVWEFLRQHPGLRTDGHNVFLYHHPAGPELPMDIDFGVEIIRPFEPSGDVLSTETPAGKSSRRCMSAPMNDWAKRIKRFMFGRHPTRSRLPENPGKFTATGQTTRRS
jgi:hypothetical protein